MAPQKLLTIAPAAPELCAGLSASLSISPITAQLLVNRGIRSTAEAADFLAPVLESLRDPFSFSEMAPAVNLVRRAEREKQEVLIYGDYDVDGVTSIAVLKNALAVRGIKAHHLIPHRVKEGYGLNAGVVKLAREKNVKLVITVDCGTNSTAILSDLRREGIEVIVTDHHEPSFSGDHPASALINPKVDACGYAFKELAGVGVAFKLCQALTGDPLFHELDLVSLGTIADSVPLVGENRVFAKEGMKRIFSTTRPGLRSLMDQSGVKDRAITAECISFMLAPRINASGRMDTADKAFELLTCGSWEAARLLAGELDGLNRQRQKVEMKILEEALAIIERENSKDHKVIVVAGEGWHTGCLGIVASKIADRFYRPAILISLDGAGKGRGSGRSIRNFHLFAGLNHCGGLLADFGGHEHAVGMSIMRENIREFSERINLFASGILKGDDLIPGVEADLQVGLSAVTARLLAEIERLEPFGEGNPEPVFHTPGLFVKGQSRVLGRQTLKFWVSDGNCTLPAIAFGMAAWKERLDSSKGLDLVYRPKIDSWQGQDSVILEVKELFLSQP